MASKFIVCCTFSAYKPCYSDGPDGIWEQRNSETLQSETDVCRILLHASMVYATDDTAFIGELVLGPDHIMKRLSPDKLADSVTSRCCYFDHAGNCYSSMS